MVSIDPRLVNDVDPDLFEVAVAEAVNSGAAGDEALCQALGPAHDYRRVTIVSALGEAEGPFGVPMLESLVLDQREDSDVRCAGLVALSKRIGIEASPILVACLSDGDPGVQSYALHCLSCVGDDRGWSEVHRLLRTMLAGPPPKFPFAMDARGLSIQSENLMAIGYLARHLTTPLRRTALIEAVVNGWDRLYHAEQKWLEEHWPACTPDQRGNGPDPDITWLTSWLCHPLMAARYSR